MDVYSRAPELAERVQIGLTQEMNDQYNHPFPTSYSLYKCVSLDLLLINSFHSSQAQYAAAFKTSASSKNWPYHYHNPTKIVLTMSSPVLMIYVI